jgi:hypothetical protein
LRSKEHAGWVVGIPFDRLDLEVSEYLGDVLRLEAPEVKRISVELESRRPRRGNENGVLAEDFLEIVHHAAPIPNVLEHFGADHQVEGFGSKATEQALRWADYIDSRPRKQVDTGILRWPQRHDDAPDYGIGIAGAHLQHAPAADVFRPELALDETLSGRWAHPVGLLNLGRKSC